MAAPRPRLIAKAAPPAPTRPPRLKSAWNEDMMGRPYVSSTLTPWAFMATSRMAFHAPKRPKAATVSATLGVSTGSVTVAQSPRALADVMARLPTRPTSQPAKGRAITAPTAIPSRTRPSPPSEIPSRALRSGIWGSQLARTAPLMKKTAATAVRARVGTGVGSIRPLDTSAGAGDSVTRTNLRAGRVCPMCHAAHGGRRHGLSHANPDPRRRVRGGLRGYDAGEAARPRGQARRGGDRARESRQLPGLPADAARGHLREHRDSRHHRAHPAALPADEPLHAGHRRGRPCQKPGYRCLGCRVAAARAQVRPPGYRAR